jgi:uncharacterized protein YgfB (UPF0149 family)
MPKKNGVALMILEKNKKSKGAEEEDSLEPKEALLGACSEFLSAIGIEVSEDKEKDACEALLDFVQIALNSDDEDY